MIIAARILIVLTLLFAPWAFGSVEPWSQRTLQILIGTAWVLAATHALGHRSLGAGPRSIHWGGAFTALAGYVAVQAANPSFRHQIADGSLLPQVHLAWLPHSVDPAATWEALAMLLAYGALFWTVRQSFADPASVKMLVVILVVSGFLMALTMIGHKFSGDGKLLWIRNSRGGGGAGPFVNRNNYVAYINMVIPMTLALGAYCHSLSQRRNTRPVVSGSDSSHLVYFMAAIMAGSTFLSGSRAGIIICGGLVGAWIIKAVNTSVGRWRQSRSFSWGRFLIPFSLVTMILAAVLAAMGVEHIVAQTARTQTALSELTTHGGRMDAYRGTLAMFSDHWLYGSGAGAFSSLFPFYQPEGVSGWLRYAHSDWLQWFAELGMVGSIFAVAALWSAFRMSHTSCHLPSAPRSFPLFLAVCGVSLHAWVDFPLHIPGVATLAVALLALLSLPMAQTNPESHITDYHQCNPT